MEDKIVDKFKELTSALVQVRPSNIKQGLFGYNFTLSRNIFITVVLFLTNRFVSLSAFR